MRRIHILRHAKAEPGFPDSERPLASRGLKHARQLGSFLGGKNGFEPRIAWCSPLLRARQTLESFLEPLGSDLPVDTVERLEPMADPFPLVDRISALDADLLVVGHNPNLEILASLLVSGERGRARIRLKTCSLLSLELSGTDHSGRSGPCEMQWLLDPRLL